MQLRCGLERRYAVEGSKFDLRWWRERRKRIGRMASASHIGRGIRIVSVKQVVGNGEERIECGPKPSGLLLQSRISMCDFFPKAQYPIVSKQLRKITPSKYVSSCS